LSTDRIASDSLNSHTKLQFPTKKRAIAELRAPPAKVPLIPHNTAHHSVAIAYEPSRALAEQGKV
jgi:hypothetical protein